MTLSVGQIVQSRYRIEALLGQGGFGAVYRALDLNINYVVALKENLDASPEAERQFAREAALLVRLRHPSLPRVTDTFVATSSQPTSGSRPLGGPCWWTLASPSSTTPAC